MFRVLKGIILLLIISNQLIAQTSSSLVAGNENLQRRNFKEALVNFNLVLKENPTHLQALCGSALAQNGLGNTQEALSLAESALSLSPQSEIANYTKGEVLLSAKDYTGAIALYNKAIAANNSYFQAYIGKSKAHNLLGDAKEAFKVLDNAIAAFPSSAELFHARGLLNNNKERYSKALSDFDRALRLNEKSNTFSAYYNRGIAYSFLQEYESAMNDFNKAAELEPQNANVYYSRGLAQYQLGNYETSINDFLRSDELNPNNPVTYYNLGMAYYKLDNIENACVYFHRACGMKNTNACKMVIMVCSEKPSR